VRFLTGEQQKTKTQVPPETLNAAIRTAEEWFLEFYPSKGQ
jgi:hypothetical protein